MNIISKLNASLIVTILIKASLFGSKPVHGKFNLPLDKAPQIVLNDFDEEIIPDVLNPWITIFNQSEGVKILEIYNAEYDKFIERQKKYTKALANVSHVNFVKRQVQIENLLKSPFFITAREAYVSKKSDFINKMVSFVFESDYFQKKPELASLMNRHLEAWDLFMQPYYYYSFFDFMGMQAIGTVVFDQLQQYVIRHINNNRYPRVEPVVL